MAVKKETEKVVTEKKKQQCQCDHKKQQTSGNSAIYGLGVIGSMVYLISTATSFWVGVLGVLKAFFWPAFVIYELLRHLQM